MSRAAFIARGFMSSIGRTHPGRGAGPAPLANHQPKDRTMPNDTPAIAAARAEGFAAGVAEALGRPPGAGAAKPQGTADRADDSDKMLASMGRELARAGLAKTDGD